jgi:Protein of unknown function (DUF1549)/Protein of unknown function (DUF1553)
MAKEHSLAAVVSVALGAGACHGASPASREAARSVALDARDVKAEGELTPAGIDRALRAAWGAAGLAPSPPASDAGFYRRAWLDLAGVVPPPDKVKAFLADGRADKRRAAIDELVKSDRFANHAALRWEHLLIGTVEKSPGLDRAAFRAWVKHAVLANEPYDRFVRDLLTASGRNNDEQGGTPNGAVNWFLRFPQGPEDLAGTASRAFLGVQIQCAQCHDHKTEAWKQVDFQRFAAAFTRTRAEPIGDDKGPRKTFDLHDVDVPAFLAQGPKKVTSNPIGRSIPRALDGTDLSRAPNRRAALAAWITDPKNPWFAKAYVNRVWSDLLGRGFVDPVDDLRPSNTPLLPELFERLAADFAAHGFDVRRLVTMIASTDAYALSSAPAKTGDGRLWSRFAMQPLGPDELLDAIVAAAGMEPLLARLAGDDLEGLRDDLRRQMTFVFDVDEQPDPSKYEGNVAQALFLANGRLVNGAASLYKGDALAEVLAAAHGDAGAAVEALYLRTLSRLPTDDEKKHWVRFVNQRRETADDDGADDPPRGGKGKNKNAAKAASAAERKLARGEKFAPRVETPRQQAFEDLLWALLNSSEFTFNH